MKATELFKFMSEDLCSQILNRLQQSDKESFDAALHALAMNQRLRPVFVARKKPAEKEAWMRSSLARPNSELIGFNLLRAWLIDAQTPLRVDFLDAVKIPHDGKGMVDDIKCAPAKEVWMEALEIVGENYPGEVVRIYLECFLMITSPDQGWGALLETCAKDPRFKLGNE
jgi:hypothetical protein